MVSIPILVLATFSLVSRNFLLRLLHFSAPALKALWRADAASLKPSAVAETVYVSLPNSRTLLVETQPTTSSDIDKITNL